MQKNLSMIRGDTFEFVAKFNGLENDLTAAYFTVKTSPDATANILQKSIGTGITKIASGEYDVKVAPADTANVSPGYYYYDCQVTTSDGDVHTIINGLLEIKADITR